MNLAKASMLARLNGNKKSALSLHEMSKAFRQRQRQLNQMASKMMFRENNKKCSADATDHHELYACEALARKNIRPLQITHSGNDRLRTIVGKIRFYSYISCWRHSPDA
ncbi:hypothetical protein BOTBODRAFT_213309 [Botryobasidium botryosum FD-172 SS1]|uniref:Uncharacterized protein n=1 Tax=Botryobasidium botryosum (strain FD-172 SS1) TaxID=930990 RepID=A0A067N495_BOTB1|nr:hypothetical protein BOTBODRAFT_213309 [Botryobasidium botryosum FD-172 SS1]